MIRWTVVLIFGTLLIQPPAGAQQQGDVPAKELLAYIRDAREAGLKDPEIRQNAVKAGWSSAEVVAAIASSPMSGTASKGTAKTTQASADQPLTPAPAGGAGNSAADATTAMREAAPESPANANLAITPENTITSMAGAPKPAVINRGVPDEYRIGEGDVVQVSVWGEPTASVQNIVVRPDGKITLPLIKDIAVAGLTPAEAEKTVTEKLAGTIKAPDVTVIVSAINSKKVFMVGAVKKEGPISYTYRMTVMQAISEAGGLTDYAKRKKIYVLRNENGRQYQLPFDYDAVLKGQHMELNHTLQPGDTLVIPH